MATIRVCDRCTRRIDGNQGMELEVADRTRGQNGKKELCGDCAGSFTIWWEEWMKGMNHRLAGKAELPPIEVSR